MRRLKALFLVVLAMASLSTATPAAAHEEYFWQRIPEVGPRARSRLDHLADRAMTELRDAGPMEAHEIGDLVNALSRFGYCDNALKILRLRPLSNPENVFEAALSASVADDQECAHAIVEIFERAARGGSRADPLYRAGALWRRMGEEQRGLEMIRLAEERLRVIEAGMGRDRDGRPYTPQHGGAPPQSPTWASRIFSLRIYHGSALHDRVLREFAEEALALHTPYRSVLDDLSHVAAWEGQEELAARLAAPLNQPRPQAAEQGTAYWMLNEERYDELVALLNDGFRNRELTLMPRLARAAPDLLYENRAHIRNWQEPRYAADSLFAIADHFIEQGDLAKARNLVVEARALYDSAPDAFFPTW